MSDIDATVIDIVAKVAKVDPASLGPQTRLAEDLMVKSIGRIELGALIDDALGTTTTNFEIRRPKTIQELVDLVTSKM